MLSFNKQKKGEECQTMTNFNQKASELFNRQVSGWELARTNYKGLETVRTKTFSFDGYDIRVQFNPARIASSGAKTDAKSIAERKCFLCLKNLPAEQEGIDAGEYTILVNPFPIFPEHFTIPRKEHVEQRIKPYFADMLELARAMDNYVVFYNGSKCGASAPDHMHFQAGTKDFLPLMADYKRLKPMHAELLDAEDSYELFSLKNYGRKFFCIESDSIAAARNVFEKMISPPAPIMTSPPTPLLEERGEEPMMNIVCSYENGIWYTYVLPRKAFRPWQYTAEGDAQLMVSPATVELGGIFITPIESHFERITKEDVASIFEQCSF